MENKYFYSTEVEWTGERRGDLRAPVLPSLHVDAPPEFKGHEGVWTPDHLFVAAVNSCFMTTFLAIAENSKLEFVSFKADAQGKLEKLERQGFMMTRLRCVPSLVITNARDAERASRILEKAERNCLISNSVKTEIRPSPRIVAVQLLGAKTFLSEVFVRGWPNCGDMRLALLSLCSRVYWERLQYHL